MVRVFLSAPTKEEALAGVDELMLDKKFGSAGNTIVIEEFMTGREDYLYYHLLTVTQSGLYHLHRITREQKMVIRGLNTGGMGNFSPSPFYTKEVDDFCQKYVYQPTVDAMKAEGRPFKGCYFLRTYAYTLRDQESLRYNARFGDPRSTGCSSENEE